MSKTDFVVHCIQFIVTMGAGVAIGVHFDSSAIAIYLIGLAVFIANISFYVEVMAKDTRG